MLRLSFKLGRFLRIGSNRARTSLRSLRCEPLEDRRVMSVTPHLVADININDVGSKPSSLTVVGDDLYIVAEDQLWRHDGEQTARVSAIDSEGVAQLPPVGFDGDVYFVADTYSESFELWRYDGDDVSIAVDLRPGTESEVASEPSHLIRFAGSLYFTADDNIYGRELWRFDGETAEVAANISVAPSNDEGPLVDQGSYPEQVIEHGGNLYFFADDGVQGQALWRFDGNVATMVADVDPENTLGHNMRLLGLTSIGDRLYFLAGNHDLSSDQTLWSFDGQEAAPLVTLDTNAQTNDAQIVEFAGSLHVLLSTSDGRFHLWQYDGSAAAPIVIQENGYPWDAKGVVYQNALYFALNDPQYGSELHRYDGETVERLTDITPGPGDSVFGALTEYRGKLYFAASDNGNDDVEVWSYDGTNAALAIDLWPGNDSSSATVLFARDDRLYLSARDGAGRGGLWSTDGNGASFEGNVSGVDWRYAVVDNNIYSVTRTNEFGYELSVFDGTHNRRITDLCPGPCYGVSFTGVVALGDEIFFAGWQGTAAPGIWKYVPGDGTFQHFDTLPITRVHNSIVIGDQLYIADSEAVMRYDGVAFEDVTNLFPPRPELTSMTLFEGRWFLNAAQAINDEELWSTDLTPGGSRLEGDLRPGVWGTDPNNLTVWNGSLYFIGFSLDYWGANSLWKYQSGEAQIVSGDIDIATSPFDDWLEVFDDKLYFSASRQDIYDHEIWTYDGTEVREAVVLSPGTLQSEDAIPHNFHVFQDALYFTAHTPANGRELWKLTVDAHADLNGDDAVDFADLAILVGNLGKSSGLLGNDGDLDGDGRVGIRDLMRLRSAITLPVLSASASVLARAPERVNMSADTPLPQLRAERRVREKSNSSPEIVPSVADQVFTDVVDARRGIASRRSRAIVR